MRSATALLLILLFALPAAAQDTPPPTPGAQSDSVERAENAAQNAQDAVNNAFNLLGLFEAIGLIATLFIAGAGVVGTFYLRNIQRAVGELDETRKEVAAQLQATRDLQATSERLDDDLKEARERLQMEAEKNRAELQALRERVESSNAELRESTSRALVAQSLLNLGERQYRATDLQGAIETYRRAIHLDPHNAISHYQLGYVYIQNGMPQEAQKHLETSLRLDPELPQALAALGYAQRRIAEKLPDGVERNLLLNKAEGNLLQALHISPRMIDNDGQSWWGPLGGMYRRMGRMEQALDAYTRAAQVTPNSSYPFANMALLYMQKGDHDLMSKTYQRVEQLAATQTRSDANNYWAFNDLLAAQLAQKKFSEAEETLRALLYSAPFGSTYSLELLMDTLSRLEGAMDAAQQPDMQTFIARIREQIESRKNANVSNEMKQLEDHYRE